MTESEFMDEVRQACLRHGASRVVLFGSRARGTAAPSSDFDVAVFGVADVRRIANELEALPTLYSADVVNMETCTNDALMREVDEYGIRL